MPIPNPEPALDLDVSTVMVLGFRAVWLHGQMASPAAGVLTPRDLDLLTFIATRPHGVPEAELLTRASARGIDRTRGHRIEHLIAQGWLGRYTAHPVRIDLPPADLAWIERSVGRLTATTPTEPLNR